MESYMFFNWNDYSDDDIDLTKEEYENLLSISCKYCDTVAFFITDENVKFQEKLEPFRIAKPSNIVYPFTTKCKDEELGIRFYKACPELCKIMIESIGSIFEWLNARGFKNPEDPTFYRSDGSVFLDTTIHEGVLTLTPREDEDVSSILADSRWIKTSFAKIYGNKLI